MNHYTMGTVCTLIGVPRHRVLYALDRKFVQEPQLRVNGCRVFSDDDVRVLKTYFAQKHRGGEVAS